MYCHVMIYPTQYEKEGAIRWLEGKVFEGVEEAEVVVSMLRELDVLLESIRHRASGHPVSVTS